MDLIYADKNKNDIGVLKSFTFDLAFGVDENNFEITTTVNNNVCDEDYLIYMHGTEYGGIIDSIKVDTALKQLKYCGRTWHGILNSKVISPNSGTDYLVLSGDANTIINTILTRSNLQTLFKIEGSSGITLSNYQFARYCKVYDGICDMLKSVNAKLQITYKEGWIVLNAVPIVEYMDDELDSNHISLRIEKTYNPVNHLICLGQGSLRNRTVVHLYSNANGEISQTQTYTGLEEVAEVYDYPNVESTSDLTKEGTKRLKELFGSDVVEMNLDSKYSFDIGDVLHTTDITTNINVTKRVIKKIVTIQNDSVYVNYKVGE